MSDLIRPIYLRLARAKTQTQKIVFEIEKWVENNPLSMRTENDESCFRLILNDFNEPAPLEELGLLFGECIHNLRSSLDNLAFAPARLKCDPPKDPISIYFPIYKDRERFEGSKRCIEQLPYEAALLIELLQPFQRDGTPENGTPERDPLLLLCGLNNQDKHRIPSLVILAQNSIEHSLEINIEDLDTVPPDTILYGGPLEPNCVLLEIKNSKKIHGKGRSELTANISLEHENKRLEVGDLLNSLGCYTELVIAQFQRFF